MSIATRYELLSYMNTGTKEAPVWSLIGEGFSDLTENLNPKTKDSHYIHQKSGEVIDYYNRMENLKSRVDGRFFQCHRSYLVNLDYVRGCEAGQVLLPNGERIPLSRLRERELTQALLRHMKARRIDEKHKDCP